VATDSSQRQQIAPSSIAILMQALGGEILSLTVASVKTLSPRVSDTLAF
jgi:hypothetical protein